MSAMRIATRGSQLALWQANEVARVLRAAHPAADVQIVELKTTGDAIQDQRLADLPGTGVFTKEVDAAVLDQRGDVGVHSLKDQVTDLDERLVVAAVLPRGPVEDALIVRGGKGTLADLPAGARVATGSLRRAAQLNRLRPDLRVVDIRGNVDSRLEKLDGGVAEALILARAGLERMGLGERIAQVLSEDDFRPAVSQGIVAMVCRASDTATRERLAAVNHEPTHLIARAERAFLHKLEGGCNVPAGVSTRIQGTELQMEGRVLGIDGSPCLEARISGRAASPEDLGEQLAASLQADGAGVLIKALRS